METEARLFGCVASSGPSGTERSIRERYQPKHAGWRSAELPGAGFVAVASGAMLFEDADGVTAAAGWRVGREIHEAARRAGSEFTAVLDGQFCAARFDNASRSLHLAVDTFGIERLFYCDRNGIVCFSDDVATLWSWFDAGKKPCAESIDAYFTLFQIPAPLSGFANIAQVPPNSVVTVRNGGISVKESVWMPEIASASNKEESLRDLEWELGAKVADGVGPGASAALLFSGGVDSMLLASVLSRRGVSLEAHSFGEEGSEELKIAATRAAWLKVPHQRWTMPPRLSLAPATLKWRMPVASIRIPYVDWFCEQVGRQKCLLVSGSGADGVFSGDPIWRRIAKQGDGPLAATRLYRRAKHFARRYLYGSGLRRRLCGRAPEAVLIRAYEQQGPLFQYLMAAKPSIIDAYARAVGRNSVVFFPFLSRQVIQLALRLNDERPKGALKTLLARSVPSFPIDEAKRGFGQSVRLEAMFAGYGGASSWASSIAQGPLCAEGFLDAQGVRLLFGEAVSDSAFQGLAWSVGALDARFRLLIAA